MSNIISIRLQDQIFNETIVLDTISYKGETDIALDLTGINEDIASALNVIIDWGDGSDQEGYSRDLTFSYRNNSILPEIETGKVGGSILGQYDHAYDPVDTHILQLSAQVVISYEDGNYTKLVQPINLIQESYYDNIKELQIVDAVINDDTLATMLTLQSKYNNRMYLANLYPARLLTVQEIADARLFITEPDNFSYLQSEDGQSEFGPEKFIFI